MGLINGFALMGGKMKEGLGGVAAVGCSAIIGDADAGDCGLAADALRFRKLAALFRNACDSNVDLVSDFGDFSVHCFVLSTPSSGDRGVVRAEVIWRGGRNVELGLALAIDSIKSIRAVPR